MAIGPILPGRLPNSLIGLQIVDNLNTVQDALNNVEQQIETGQAFFTPGQNPTATSNVLLLQTEAAGQTQFQTNLTTDQSFLQATDTALGSVASTIDQANALLLNGIGDTSTAADKQSFANQVGTLIQGLLNTANSNFQGRYLFAGTATGETPFSVVSPGVVRYNGNQGSINSNVGTSLVLPNNVDGITAFGAVSTPVGASVNPALTAQTNLSDLNSGRGVALGSIQVTVTNGPPVTKTVDLSGARTIGDVEQLIQNAFPPAALAVAITAGSPQQSLTITPAAGTVTVSDINGGRTAADLGIAGGPSASIVGGNLSPQLTLQTPLSALNGGSGASTTHGILINDGPTSQVVNISGDVTVQDLFNTLQAADPNLDLGINAAGNGLSISTRLSGVNFSIGENGGNDATSLGIRTLTGSTPLSQLNLGQGVPLATTNPPNLEIVRRSGTTVDVNLAGSVTVQDVLDKINAVDPGKLVATLNSVGNGISITDNDGVSTGPLTVTSNGISTALGIAGTESSNIPTNPLVGTDVNPIQANGVFNLMEQLQTALATNNNAELSRLQPLFQQELLRVSTVQSSLGSREQMLVQVQGQVSNEQTGLQSSISKQLNVDMATAITNFTQLTTTLQASLKVSASSMQLSLFNFL